MDRLLLINLTSPEISVTRVTAELVNKIPNIGQLNSLEGKYLDKHNLVPSKSSAWINNGLPLLAAKFEEGGACVEELIWFLISSCDSFMWFTTADSFSTILVELKKITAFITPILKSLVVPVFWLALIGAIYSRIAPFFALNRIFFSANEEATLKTKQAIRFQGLFKVTHQIAGKWETKSIMWQILQRLFPKLLFFPPNNGWI